MEGVLVESSSSRWKNPAAWSPSSRLFVSQPHPGPSTRCHIHPPPRAANTGPLSDQLPLSDPSDPPSREIMLITSHPIETTDPHIRPAAGSTTRHFVCYPQSSSYQRVEESFTSAEGGNPVVPPAGRSSAEGGNPVVPPAGRSSAGESERVGDQENVCRDVFSWSTKRESEKPRPAGTSRLQTQIRGWRDGRRRGGVLPPPSASVKPGSRLTASASDGGGGILVSWWIRGGHQTAWQRSVPGRHMGPSRQMDTLCSS
ncbi:unnamed protein product [Pleuronectes platessa]|uniref:Uncharacterized protein n=1 Tax=Pleuronectes platessa TaxID=8262 RepID=A0A9N7VLN8_PLEPL|nr:unnamed protein product [Pleuronectes platessa]